MIGKVISLAKYGRLTAIVLTRRDENSRQIWLCKCDCGKAKLVRADGLLSGDTVSCGCFNREQSAKRARRQFKKHGMCTTPEYKCWRRIHRRCYETANNRFKYYGALGVQVCSRWHRGTEDAFKHFFSDMGSRPSKDHSIDRINTEGHYMPSNCRWATRSEQRRNRRGGK